ncbi:MAG: thioesterase family protein [Pseudomonadota bacterium]
MSNSAESVGRAIPIERVVSTQPYIVRRRVAFRDCDPAGIVYTPRFLDPIATSAGELFMAELVGVFGQRDEPLKGVDFPAKALSMVFHSPARHGDILDLHVGCARIGNTSFDTRVDAFSTEGQAVFTCTMTVVCIDPGVYQSCPIPDYMREKLAPHLRAES